MQPSLDETRRWWQWPTILSLDAPAVVLAWQEMLAHAAAVRIGAPERVVLASSVWLAYAADRWIEGWRIPPADVRTHRHRFYQRHRRPIAAVWAAVLGIDVAAALDGLDAREFRAGFLLLALVAAYLFSHQLLHRASRWRAPKEACVALLLTGGAAVFVATRPGADLQGIALPLTLFALLCFANCALISVWENEVDRIHGQTSLALQFGGGAAASRTLPWIVGAGASAAWIAAGRGQGAPEACAAASAVLLILVDRAEHRIGRVPARVLADVALLTPVVPLLLGGPL